MVHTILRRKDVEKATGLPRSSIYELMDRNEFPRPIKLSSKSVGWIESEIQSWINAKIIERDGR